MTPYSELSKSQLSGILTDLQKEYAQEQEKKLKLDLSRGKPDQAQLNLTMGYLDVLNSSDSPYAHDGSECRNYGILEGIPEARELMAQILDLAPEEVFIGGNSSLNMMHDCLVIAYIHGFPQSEKPWGKLETVKVLCPAPGYDRHFAVSAHFGFELVTVPMTSFGPDMDMVEELVKNDSSIKMMWNIPKYSNPTGITYSDETVRRLANLSPAAADFRIFWDNAYAVHDLHPGEGDVLLNLMAELKKNGKEDMAFLFTSTSKIAFPGGGIAAMGAAERNMAYMKKHFALQTIGYDKLNQLRHVRYFKDINGIKQHMTKHAALLLPKFTLMLDTLQQQLGGLGIASWDVPRGGYFISLDAPDGCAKRIVQLCGEAGVAMTPAGATYPYSTDSRDRNIRIAPTFATLEELAEAAQLFCLCVRIAAAEKLLEQKQ